jgi:probable F420-dependent oxidoreductase
MFYEPITNLAFCAGITDRIRLGIAVLILPCRDPVSTAKQLACLDSLSGGRLNLGIGQGGPQSTRNVDFEVLGISRKDKVKRTREYFEAIRKIWTEDSPSFTGSYVTYDGATIYPKPVQAPYPPIWIGGSSELSLKMITDYADVWLSSFLPPERMATPIADIHRRLRERGRSTKDFRVAVEIQIMLAETTEEARRLATPTMSIVADNYSGATGFFVDDKEKTDPIEEYWQSSLVGSPEDVTERLREYVSAGCSAFELKFIYFTIDHMLEQWKMFVERVAPAFR